MFTCSLVYWSFNLDLYRISNLSLEDKKQRCLTHIVFFSNNHWNVPECREHEQKMSTKKFVCTSSSSRGYFFNGTTDQTFLRVAAVGKLYCLFKNVSASATTAATTTTTTNDRIDEEADESERAAWMALPVERGPQGSADSRFRSGVHRPCYPIENAGPDLPTFVPPRASFSLLFTSLRFPFLPDEKFAHRTHRRSLIKISILIVRQPPSRADVLAGAWFHARVRGCSYARPLSVIRDKATPLFARFCRFRSVVDSRFHNIPYRLIVRRYGFAFVSLSASIEMQHEYSQHNVRQRFTFKNNRQIIVKYTILYISKNVIK